jgi:iron complex outermembrane receptor protein
VFGKSFDRPASVGGAKASLDSQRLGRAGFRADWASREGDNFMAMGDIYRGTAAVLGPFDPFQPLGDRKSMNRLTGEDLQVRWKRTQSSRSDTTLQAFYDHSFRSQANFVLDRRTLDVDFQHHLKLGSRNDVVWGADYRSTKDHTDGGALLQIVRDSNTDNVMSAFAQDEIQVAPRFRVTIGSKIQYDPEWRVQLQPTLRLLFKANERQTLWAAATSAIRPPSEIERSVRLNVGAFPDGTPNGGLIVLTGNSDLVPERVEAYEVGYRWQATPNVGFDATAFHNVMRRLIGTSASAPFRDSTGRTIIPIDFANSGRRRANGAEFVVTGSVAANWNVALGYSFFQSAPKQSDTSSPGHQLQLRSYLQLSRELELDSSAYYVGRLGSDVQPYLRLDTQLSWRPARRWELSISGQNLLKARHSEFVGVNGESEVATPARRTVNGKITWRF